MLWFGFFFPIKFGFYFSTFSFGPAVHVFLFCFVFSIGWHAERFFFGWKHFYLDKSVLYSGLKKLMH